VNESRAGSPACAASDHYDFPLAHSPLALNSKEPLLSLDDQIASSALANRCVYGQTQLRRRKSNRHFGNRAFLVGRQLHAFDRTRGLGGAVSALDSRF
jgi:hypothetical protein